MKCVQSGVVNFAVITSVFCLAAAVAQANNPNEAASDNAEDMAFQAPWNGEMLGTGIRRPSADQWAWGESSTSPFKLNWNTKKLSAGSHALTCIASDAAGNSAMSPVVSVTK